MELLKKAFTPKTDKIVDDYLDLIYREEAEDDENESTDSDNNILAAIATFLDSRFKYFNWATDIERNRAQNLLEVSFIQAETDDDNE
ncbi:7312_t:CDS:2, partial [Dentiscutata heterogama]